MDRRLVRTPRPLTSEVSPAGGAKGTETAASPSTGKANRQRRPGWKPTLLRRSTFLQLRAIQKSTTDYHLDLSFLTDACVAMALEQGGPAIVQRALQALSARPPGE